MQKDELKKKLLNAFKMEEAVVNLYVLHLHEICERCSIDKKIKEEIQSILDLMVKISEKHKNSCQNILSRIEGAGKDVF